MEVDLRRLQRAPAARADGHVSVTPTPTPTPTPTSIPTPMLQPMSVTLPLVSPESDFIAAILRAARTPAASELAGALAGARGQLAALVNAMFWASVTTEEGRPTTGIVSLCPPDHPNASSFEEPVAVTRESLVRLLTALPVTALA